MVPKGFTMVELLLAMVLLGVGLAGAGRLLVACSRGAEAARARMAFREAARNALEEGRPPPARLQLATVEAGHDPRPAP